MFDLGSPFVRCETTRVQSRQGEELHDRHGAECSTYNSRDCRHPEHSNHAAENLCHLAGRERARRYGAD